MDLALCAFLFCYFCTGGFHVGVYPYTSYDCYFCHVYRDSVSHPGGLASLGRRIDTFLLGWRYLDRSRKCHVTLENEIGDWWLRISKIRSQHFLLSLPQIGNFPQFLPLLIYFSLTCFYDLDIIILLWCTQ